ncbi:hypothetical protein P7K49_018290 [Saguinus oedipus]|uniref:Uncharacterized protein n=1 Tax=Saguinus oedipus TaxID=9490 RepID=A0ABQ9V4Z2_SAGOE|nr:hypothetical protein P7K49_018290 [Saguinus oedipus]
MPTFGTCCFLYQEHPLPSSAIKVQPKLFPGPPLLDSPRPEAASIFCAQTALGEKHIWSSWNTGPSARECPGAQNLYLDHLMFTLSPATTHNSLAVSPSGTVTVGGIPKIVSSPGHKDKTLLATLKILSYPCHLTPKAPQNCHFTQNSELDPSLVSVLPVESNTGVKAAIFYSHLADEQGAIRLQLVSGDQV